MSLIWFGWRKKCLNFLFCSVFTGLSTLFRVSFPPLNIKLGLNQSLKSPRESSPGLTSLSTVYLIFRLPDITPNTEGTLGMSANLKVLFWKASLLCAVLPSPERSPSCLRSRVAWCSWRTPSSRSTSRPRTCSVCRRTWTRLCPAWITSSVTTTWPKTRTGSSERGEAALCCWTDAGKRRRCRNGCVFVFQADGQVGWVSRLYRKDSESCGVLSG